MTHKLNRRDFAKTTGAAAAVAVAGLSISTSHTSAEETKTVIESDELVPGMAAQAKGVKCYVESDYAPLKACIVGNPSSIVIPDPDTWEMSNMFAHSGEEFNAYLRKHKGKSMKDVDPKRYERCAHESNSLAEAYRKAGVKVIRNETGKTPEGVVNGTLSWSKQKHLSLYGQSAFEVFGHCLVQFWEVTCSQTEFAHREALVEIMKNDPEAVWLSMPPLYPSVDQKLPGPTLSPGDPLLFDKTVVLGIGVSDKSHVKDTSQPRSSGDEFGNEILRRMLAPFGWKVETVYFDSRLSYHLDCVVTPLEEGLIAMPKNGLWTPLPAQYRDWEVIDVDVEDVKAGAMNNEVIGGKRIVLPAGTKFARDIEKRGWTCIEVPYETCYATFGSGIHCSTASIWRES